MKQETQTYHVAQARLSSSSAVSSSFSSLSRSSFPSSPSPSPSPTSPHSHTYEDHHPFQEFFTDEGRFKFESYFYYTNLATLVQSIGHPYGCKFYKFIN